MPNKYQKKSAFTILEIAVVITIIAIIGGLGLAASRDMVENAKEAATQNRLDAIEKALFTFWQKKSNFTRCMH